MDLYIGNSKHRMWNRALSYIAILCSACFLLLALHGCGRREEMTAADGRPIVVVQCFAVAEDFQRCVEDMCPDICIKWFTAQELGEAYGLKSDNELPDIVARSTAFLDEKPEAWLRDVSAAVTVADYSRNIIDIFRFDDGSIYWVPTIGAGDVLVANNELFEEYGIDLPTDYESLVEVDRAFKSHGLDGVAWGLGTNWTYSPMLMAQVLGADLFNSYEGMKWRERYLNGAESGGDYVLDKKIWPQVMERLRGAMECGLIDDTDMQQGNVQAATDFINGNAAICLTTTTAAKNLEMDLTFLPAFSTDGGAWMPVFINQSYGVTRKVTDDRMDVVMEVFKAIISKEAVQAYNESRGGVVPLNYDASMLSGGLKELGRAVSDGRLFLLFKERWSGVEYAMCDVLREMKENALSADEACELCRQRTLELREKKEEMTVLNSDDPSQVIYTQKEFYPLISNELLNHPASSCMANTVLASVNSMGEKQYDILVAEPAIAGDNIRKGNYYLDQEGELSRGSNLYYMCFAKRVLYPATMTVKELIQYLNTAFYYYHRVDDGLPVMAGASYVVEDYNMGVNDVAFKPNYVNAGRVANVQKYPMHYLCTAIKKDGKVLDEETVINVLVTRAEVFYMTEYTEDVESEWVGFDPAINPMNEEKAPNPLTLVVDWLKKGNDLCRPTRYLELIRKW